MKHVTVFALFLFALLALQGVSAQETVLDDTFSVAISEQANAFVCTSTNSQFSITNNAGTTQQMDIGVSGSAASWISFSALSVVLLPAQTKTITEFFDLPCTAKDSRVSVVVTTQTGEQQVFQQTILAQRPVNLEFGVLPARQTVQPCNGANYTITLKNPLLFDETYKLGVQEKKLHANFSESTVLLSGNTTKKVSVELVSTSCSLSGDFTPVFTVDTQNTRLHAEIEAQLTVLQTGIATIAPEVYTIRTNYNQSVAPLLITNIGPEPVTYAVSLRGIDWVTAPATITVPAGTANNLLLTLAPFNTTDAGLYKLNITLKADKTNATYEKLLYVSLKGPFVVPYLPAILRPYQTAVLVSAAALLVILIVVVLLIIRASRKKVRVEVVEQKPELDERALAKQRAKEEKLAQQKALDAWKEKETPHIKKSALNELKAAYKLIAKKDLAQKKKPEHRWLLGIILMLVTVAVATTAWLLKAELGAYENEIRLGAGILAGVFFAVVLLRGYWLATSRRIWKKPFTQETEEVIIKGWKDGITDLSCMIESPAEHAVLQLKKGHDAGIQPPGEIYSSYALTSNVVDEIKSVEINFKVSKKWLAHKNCQLENCKLAQFTGREWRGVPTTIATEDKDFVYYTATRASPGMYAIIAKPDKKSAKEKATKKFGKGFWGVLGILALVAVAFVTYLLASPAPFVSSGGGIPVQSIPVNGAGSIDLANHFTDADGDPLTFGARTGENLSVEIAGSIANLVPEKDWQGQTYVIFSADDKKGGIMVSNAVPVVVYTPLIPLSWRPYLEWALLGVLILIVLILLIHFRKHAWDLLSKD